MSADCTPAWKPTLPPVRVTKLGFDQVPSAFFTASRPCPRRPPTTSPTLTASGTTTIARASSSSLSGMADSGIAWMSVSTRTALRARSSSAGPATAAVATASANGRARAARRRETGMRGSGAGR